MAYRPREVAEMVGMSESGVRNLIRRGTLRAVQLDGRWLIPATVIEDKLGVQLDASTAAGVAPKAEQSPMLHAAAVKAATILNNHRAKLFLSGLADLAALELGARLIGDRQTLERARSMGSDGRHSLNESVGWRPLLPVEDLRRLRPGEGVLVYGHLRPTPIRLRPYYTPAEQRRRARLEDRQERRLAWPPGQ